MSAVFRVSLLAIGLASLLGAGAASAGSLVEFANASEREPKLLGYLARPTGEGPFPAVVVLHGCGGFSSGGSLQLADQLMDWGYIALMVDSLAPRGLTTACGVPFIDQPGDPYAALRYLSQQSFVAPEVYTPFLRSLIVEPVGKTGAENTRTLAADTCRFGPSRWLFPICFRCPKALAVWPPLHLAIPC